MYTYCTIRFVDDGSEIEVIIKAYDSDDVNDDDIFYYGLSREELLAAYAAGEVIDGEWEIVSVGETLDALM